MPLGDEKHQTIYEELVNLLGEEYVEDDPAVMEGFYRDFYSAVTIEAPRLEFWVLPGSVEDIQGIYRLANRLDFPVSVTSTGLMLMSCQPVTGHAYWCLIDPKRLNRYWIDTDNMYAVLEPYVTVAQLQSVTMREGLCCGVTGAGSQCSAMAMNINANTLWTGWRNGKGRSILGVEWVLPDGSLMRIGSLANGEDFSWGEGPGPDMVGLLRGTTMGPMGSLGAITKLGVKLFPWPGPPVIPTEGVQPEKTCRLPRDIFRTFFINFPTLESCIEAVRELGEAEIGGAVIQANEHDLVALRTASREEFWQCWHSDFWQRMVHHGHIVFITLWGFAGAAQVAHEEGVLRQIVAEANGEFFPEDIAEWLHDEITVAAVRDTHRGRYARLGPMGGTGGSSESLYDALRSIRDGQQLKVKYTPPLGDGGLYDMGAENHKFWIADFGRIVTTAVGSFAEKSAEYEEFVFAKLMPEVSKHNVENHIFVAAHGYDASRTGAMYANVHHLLAHIKKELDPNNIANPTRLVDMHHMAELAGNTGCNASA